MTLRGGRAILIAALAGGLLCAREWDEIQLLVKEVDKKKGHADVRAYLKWVLDWDNIWLTSPPALEPRT